MTNNGKNGAPGGIRTHGPKIRNLVLYPAELRALSCLVTPPEYAIFDQKKIKILHPQEVVIRSTC